MSTWSLPPRYDELVRAVLAQDYINIELDSNRNQLIRVRSSRLGSLEAECTNMSLICLRLCRQCGLSLHPLLRKTKEMCATRRWYAGCTICMGFSRVAVMPQGLTACKQESLRSVCAAGLQLEVMLTSATLSVALIGVISGLFGMNLHNTHEDSYDLFVIVRPWLLQPSLF